MPTRSAEATWKGELKSGRGTMRLESGEFKGSYSYGTRFQEKPGTNPEELIGAALAGCFSMALAHILEQADHSPREIQTTARVSLGKSGDGFAITEIQLETDADVPGIEEEEFDRLAEQAKSNCPVSKALRGVNILLDARLSAGKSL